MFAKQEASKHSANILLTFQIDTRAVLIFLCTSQCWNIYEVVIRKCSDPNCAEKFKLSLRRKDHLMIDTNARVNESDNSSVQYFF